MFIKTIGKFNLLITDLGCVYLLRCFTSNMQNYVCERRGRSEVFKLQVGVLSGGRVESGF